MATGTELADYGELFDAITVCLSKGLGAPVGSLVVGSADLIEQARWWRKRMGAGMRQVGILQRPGSTPWTITSSAWPMTIAAHAASPSG